MKTWKLLLCLAVMVLLLGVAAASAEIARGTCGGCDWVINDAGVLTISPTDGVSGTLASYVTTSVTPGRQWPWYEYKNDVTAVVFSKGVKAGNSVQGMFQLYGKMTSADVSNLDTSDTTVLMSFFEDCETLSQITGLNQWKTGKVTNTRFMFSRCVSLESIDLNQWDTRALVNAQNMFSFSGFKEIKIDQWDVPKLESTLWMFRNCNNLGYVDLTWTNAVSLTNIGSMFETCKNLKSVDVSTWDTSHVKDMGNVFYASGVEEIDLSNWNTESVESFYIMFLIAPLKKITLGTQYENAAGRKIDSVRRMFLVLNGDIDVANRYDRVLPHNSESLTPGRNTTYVVGRVITFDPNDGEGTMGQQAFGYSLGKKALSPNGFTREGYVFTGWNTRANGNGTSYAASDLLGYDSFSGDITLYAQWAPAAKITFDLAGGKLDGKTGSIVLTVPKGTDITILNAPEKEGFDFAYWEGSEYYPGQTYTADEDHTFTAKWTPKPTPAPTVKPTPAPTVKPTPQPVVTYPFIFTKEWHGGVDENTVFSLYQGEKLVKTFTMKDLQGNRIKVKKTVDGENWTMTIYLRQPVTGCYVIENVPKGYSARYENGSSKETSKCLNGGKIVNVKIPKTGDSAPLMLWGLTAATALAVTALAIAKRRGCGQAK